MSLSSRLAFEFAKSAQYKGVDLLRARRIQATDFGPSHFKGTVRGGQLYQVSLRYERGNLLVGCECPAFADCGSCKHLWTAILEADRLGAVTDARQATYLKLSDDPDFDFEDSGSEELKEQFTTPSWQKPRVQIPPPPQIPAWQEHLAAVQSALQPKPKPAGWTRNFEILYAVNVNASRTAGAIQIDLLSRSRKKSGEWTAYKEFRINQQQIEMLQDPVDADALSMMMGGQDPFSYSYYGSTSTSHKTLPPALASKVIPMIAKTGRLAVFSDPMEFRPLRWDEGEPWKLWLDVRQDERDQWTIEGSLRRGEERMPLSEPALIVDGGFLLARGTLSRFDSGEGFAWVKQLRNQKRIPFPDRDREAVLAKLLASPVVPPLDVDEGLRFEERRVEPRIGLRITQHRDSLGEESFQGRLIADYGRGWIDAGAPSRGFWIPEERAYVLRDAAAEESARDRIALSGLKPVAGDGPPAWRMSAKTMPRVARELLHEGWHVEAEGKAFRRPGATRVDVRSGIDWFELHGEVDYGEVSASLPQLLAALRRGDRMIALGDGSFGLLPEEWLQRFAPLAGLGDTEEGHLRFRRNQAGLLDVMLAAQPEVRVDEVFARVRERIRTFGGVRAAEQPAGFTGHLRDYQREGIGWMEFLREFGFGGCLADDMGVGKTAQVLAMLETRRVEAKGPSLVVVPKSLIFNWRAEAARFTPQLKVLDYTGLDRDAAAIAEHNMVLTTYGTMLRDTPRLAEIEFDYIVLDEAQAIKNATTASAKAVRLLRGSHRLALSGTPVENHIGELWSLFEFLNPGMLGEAKVLKMAGGLARNPGEDARRLLRDALPPFILRRTKQQVARELPAKTEQTIFCELEDAQRKQYDDLRRHYRESLLQRISQNGLGRSKMHVLEALLRLRQAACHPGLLDARQKSEPSAKLDVLLEQLGEIREEGHKALVFSQFTSLLSIVRERLDAGQVPYEYLDGETRDRQARVEAFQNDPDCSLFLISLRAGGQGLNLTAAEYVFLLDPWWNPAVESQAIDRAHRIGQTKPVFAYRLIARDTVEEKVLELQKTKRDLADAILGEDNSLIRDLKAEDLELLLS
jgi:superfamily II DNA or RNA helicase